MSKKNCWEFHKCANDGRDLIEIRSYDCQVPLDALAKGLNGGTSGGRISWAISGSFNGGEIRCSIAKELISCLSCKFFKQVKKEEGANFTLLRPSQQYAKDARRRNLLNFVSDEQNSRY